MQSGKRIPEILLVEDNAADARLTTDALKSGGVETRVHHVLDGEQALAYLRNQGEYATAMRPSLILLDLNLPKIDGREVLAELKRDAQLRRIPVVILTSSGERADVNRCYELQANGYIVKPLGHREFVERIQRVGHFWLSVVNRPTT